MRFLSKEIFNALKDTSSRQTRSTAEMMDVPCIIFVRGKAPDEAMMEMAVERGILLMGTEHTMYLSSGLLYSNGLLGG